MHKTILIVGGTSGLGLELAAAYLALGHQVFVAGRTNPHKDKIGFVSFSIGANTNELILEIDKLVSAVPKINTLIYTTGYYQEGHIDKLKDNEILEMVNIGLTAPALLVQRLKMNCVQPLKFIVITSSSQFTPRENEPMYTATKSALGMLANSLSLDPEVGKVVVVAPGGMKTHFWEKFKDKDISNYLDPAWVAKQVIELSGGAFKYKFVKIFRDPARVEVTEVR